MTNNLDVFFSEGNYISWPPINKRVSLIYKNKEVFNLSAQLYKPSSKRALILRQIFITTIKKLPLLGSVLSQNKEEGAFITFLKKDYNSNIVSSIYYPTINDKIVLQLIIDNEIYGYVKVGLNDTGNYKVSNEKKAIELLADKLKYLDKDYLMNFGKYKNLKYVVFKNIEGSNTFLKTAHLYAITKSLKKNKALKLKNHPQIHKLLKDKNLRGHNKCHRILKEIVLKSTQDYFLVYEHGDLAPWNILKQPNGKYRLFDFEYFEEHGIEFMDEINYFYQLGKLVKKLKNDALIQYVKDYIEVDEFYILIQLFLIKKIVNLNKDSCNYSSENNLLSHINENYLDKL